MRDNYDIIKFIEFTLERSPRNIMETLKQTQQTPTASSSAEQTSGDWYENAVDLMDAIYYISHICDNTISPGDFFPVSMGTVLEPFLEILGVGKYSIRPSPHCGYV